MKSHEGECWRSVGFYRKMHVGWLNCVVYGRSCHHLPDNNCCVVCMVGVTAIIFAHAVANTKHKSHVCITHSCLRLKGNMNLTNRPTSAKEKNKNVIELPDPIMFFGDCRNVNMNGTHCDTARQKMALTSLSKTFIIICMLLAVRRSKCWRRRVTSDRFSETRVYPRPDAFNQHFPSTIS